MSKKSLIQTVESYIDDSINIPFNLLRHWSNLLYEKLTNKKTRLIYLAYSIIRLIFVISNPKIFFILK